MFYGLMGDEIYVDGQLVGCLVPGLLPGLRDELEDRILSNPIDIADTEDDLSNANAQIAELHLELEEALRRVRELEEASVS